MMLPGWDSLDAVKRMVAALEVTTLIFWVLLVLLEIVARSWQRFARVFDVCALIAFAFAVSGEVISHKYNRRKETLYEAREQGLTKEFAEKLREANNDAKKAREENQQAKEDAQKAATLSALAQQQASAAQAQADALKREQTPRTLSKEQRATLLELLKPEAPQELYFVCAPDPESTGYGDEITSVLSAAGWKTVVHPYNWGTLEHYTEGVQIWVADVKKPVPRGAAMLQVALKKIGVDAEGASFFMIEEGKFGLYVGLKPKSQK
jgi:hypothetical protein